MLAVFLWLLAAAAFIVIEIVTLGLTSIWFAGGAIVAGIGAAFSADIMIQLILFAVVSVILLIFTRPLAAKHITGQTTKTNVDSLIGKEAIVKEEINNRKGQGVAVVNGQEWTARTEDDDNIIEAGATVTIQKISGVKLIVK
ncbi:MAG: NfeD family protein [Firmicutes bacterium]|uniref:NfeD family protein n=1 Tax=Candidatus Scybalomonas excrementavium TaxID=2840943 RepID=A0A9D9N7U3_9FIRM|nr:NfeD family protein [Candidatus Scybalomonas excrementavium]